MNKDLAKTIFAKEVHSLNATRLLQVRSWQINELEFPIIDFTFQQAGRNSFRVRFQCENWNEQPPSISLHSEDGQFLKTLPKGSGVLNPGRHPSTGRPFTCTPGSREYHTHPSHISDHWENYKGKSNYDLGGILTQIWNAWRKTHD